MLNYTFLFVILLAFLPMGIVIYLSRQEKKESRRAAIASSSAAPLPQRQKQRKT